MVVEIKHDGISANHPLSGILLLHQVTFCIKILEKRYVVAVQHDESPRFFQYIFERCRCVCAFAKDNLCLYIVSNHCIKIRMIRIIVKLV